MMKTCEDTSVSLLYYAHHFGILFDLIDLIDEATMTDMDDTTTERGSSFQTERRDPPRTP